MHRKRRAAWEAAITKLDRRAEREAAIAELDWEAQSKTYAKLNRKVANGMLEDPITPEEHYDLLREGMLAGPDCVDEAALFLRYWFHGLNLEPLTWLGEIIAASWFHLRDWDREWGSDRAGEALRDYIAAEDFDHWKALNIIAARLHRQREALPDALGAWAAEFHEGKRPQPPKRQGNRGEPPYAHEERNGVFFMADHWLEHYGMSCATDRLAAIAAFAKVDEDVVRKGLKRWRDSGWPRAPWPKL